MLDTNICIYIIKRKPKPVITKFREFGVGNLCISSVTLAELQYGVEKSEQQERNRIALAGFLSPFDILPFAGEVVEEFGKVRATLERRGNVIDAYDMMIGAHALSEHLTLVTNNLREFQRIFGLSAENWVGPSRQYHEH